MFIVGNHAEAEAEADTEQGQREEAGQAPAKQRPKSETAEDSSTETLPPWAVLLHNDDLNGMDFVIESLLKVFTMNVEQAVALTLKAHTQGRAMVWSGHRELAELKASQLSGRGADPMMLHRGAKPLRVTVEKLPG